MSNVLMSLSRTRYPPADTNSHLVPIQSGSRRPSIQKRCWFVGFKRRGSFIWKHRKVFLGEALARQVIGVEPLDDRYYQVYFTQFPLGIFDSHTLKMLSRAQHRKVLQKFDKENSTVPSASAPETVEEG